MYVKTARQTVTYEKKLYDLCVYACLRVCAFINVPEKFNSFIIFFFVIAFIHLRLCVCNAFANCCWLVNGALLARNSHTNTHKVVYAYVLKVDKWKLIHAVIIDFTWQCWRIYIKHCHIMWKLYLIGIISAENLN